MKVDGAVKPHLKSELGHAFDTKFHLGHAMRSARMMKENARSDEVRALAAHIEKSCAKLRDHAKRAVHEAGQR